MLRKVDRKAFLLELNTSPGMTSHSLVPMSAKAANLGYADLERKIPVTDATRFWIASLTKTMSAAVVLQLAEAGTIGLSDPVAGYLPDSGLPPNILVSHLLSHTSPAEGCMVTRRSAR